MSSEERLLSLFSPKYKSLFKAALERGEVGQCPPHHSSDVLELLCYGGHGESLLAWSKRWRLPIDMRAIVWSRRRKYIYRQVTDNWVQFVFSTFNHGDFCGGVREHPAEGDFHPVTGTKLPESAEWARRWCSPMSEAEFDRVSAMWARRERCFDQVMDALEAGTCSVFGIGEDLVARSHTALYLALVNYRERMFERLFAYVHARGSKGLDLPTSLAGGWHQVWRRGKRHARPAQLWAPKELDFEVEFSGRVLLDDMHRNLVNVVIYSQGYSRGLPLLCARPTFRERLLRHRDGFMIVLKGVHCSEVERARLLDLLEGEHVLGALALTIEMRLTGLLEALAERHPHVSMFDVLLWCGGPGWKRWIDYWQCEGCSEELTVLGRYADYSDRPFLQSFRPCLLSDERLRPVLEQRFPILLKPGLVGKTQIKSFLETKEWDYHHHARCQRMFASHFDYLRDFEEESRYFYAYASSKPDWLNPWYRSSKGSEQPHDVRAVWIEQLALVLPLPRVLFAIVVEFLKDATLPFDMSKLRTPLPFVPVLGVPPIDWSPFTPRKRARLAR